MNGSLFAVDDVAEVSEWALASKGGCKVSRVVVASERLPLLAASGFESRIEASYRRLGGGSSTARTPSDAGEGSGLRS
jgi:hypothetical protein